MVRTGSHPRQEAFSSPLTYEGGTGAHPFTARELARIVQECYHQPVGYRGIQRVLAQHRLSPAALQHHRQAAQQASLPTPPPTQQLTLPLEPHTRAQRLALALGPEHLLLRFRAYDEYPTGEQARWHIIELCVFPTMLEYNPSG
jgi:hypothetical protein